MKTSTPRAWAFCLVIAFTLAGIPPARAAEKSAATQTLENENAPASDHGGPFAISLLWENDSRGFNPFNASDRHYTNGVKAVLAAHPQFAQDIAVNLPWLWADFTDARSAAGVVGGQELYTAEHHGPELDRDDRPFAGYLYGGGFLQRATDDVMDHVELDLGLTGQSSLGQNAQDMIHNFLGAEKFAGWNHQLKDEPEFNLVFERRWRVLKEDLGGKWGLDLIPHAGARLGTVYRDAEGGATLRIGYGLANDFGPGNIHHAPDYTTRNKHQPTVYAFARAEGRVVEHNLFIQGNQFRESFGTTPEPLYGEASVGVVAEIESHIQFIYSQTYMTHEFKHQDTFDSYGTFLLTVYFDF